MTEPIIERPVFRWSFSQWEAYDSCPARWKYASVLKLPRRPPGPAASRGLEIHNSVERYIQGGDEKDLHPAVKQKYIPIFDEFRNHSNGDRHTEKKMAFDAEWAICPPTSKMTAVLAVLDAARFEVNAEGKKILHIGEWKSGKPKDSHADQRKLYAMIGYRGWWADEVQTTTYYLEDTAPPQRLILKSESGFETLKTLWNNRIDTMKRDQMCAPRPSYGCNWCDFSKKNGGPCQFGG